MLLEAHHRGDESNPKDVVRAVKAVVELIGNANANLRRVKVIGDINKALLPLVGDDNNSVEAPPLLFRTEFAQKGKEMVDQVKAMRSTFTSKPARRPPFFRNAPPQQPGWLQSQVRKGWSQKCPLWSRKTIPGRERNLPEPPQEQNTELEIVHVCLPPFPKDVQKYVVKSDCMPGHSASSIRSSSSWKAARSQKHLEGVDKGPMGVRHHKGSLTRFHIKDLSGCGSSHSSLHSGSGSPDKGRVNPL